MKNIFFSTVLLLFTATMLQSQVQIQWQKCLGGSDYDIAYTIVENLDGSLVFAGYTMSIDGDVSSSNGGGDAWVVKIDTMGNIQWKKCYGGSEWEVPYSLIKSLDGGYVFAGSTVSSDGDVSGLNGGSDFWVVKIDSIGNLIWQKCLGGSFSEEAFSITQSYDGGFYIAGYTHLSDDGDVSGSHGWFDFWVVKIDSLGNLEWQKCMGGTNEEEAYSIVQTTDGGCIVAGYTMSNDGDLIGFTGNDALWIVKLDLQGNIQWQKYFGGTGNEFAKSITQTSDEGFIVVGATSSNDGDISGYHGGRDVWIIKLDLMGNLQWQKCLGGSGLDEAYSIIQTNDGSFVVAGYTDSDDSDVSGHNGNGDAWVVKLDILGNIQWQKCLGGANIEIAFSITQTKDGGFAVAGYTESNDWNTGGNHGGGDIWIVKLIEPNISGKIFHDINENAQLDSAEQGAAGHLVKLEPGPYYAFTNNNGIYYFAADSGNHTVSYIPFGYWHTTTDSSYSFSIDSAGHYIDTLHFGIKNLNNVNDVALYITGSPTRAGFPTQYWLTYKNWGTVTASGTVQFKYDSLLTYLSSSTIPTTHTGNLLVFDYDTLGPGSQRAIMVDFQVPGVQFLGDTLHTTAVINPLVPDTNILNNYDTIVQLIVASYDPNDKQVSPVGYGTPGYVLHGQRLTYTIRFQNTGTDTAFTVVLRDTLSPHLDISTILFEAWSHEPSYELQSGNELLIAFNNILLPDSNVNEPASHGFIRFSISPKSGLADNTEVSNTGYIFFDYNPAIVTHTTLNTYVSQIPLASPAIDKDNPYHTLYPNPSSESIYINLPEHTRKAEVYDINGILLMQMTPQSPVLEINISDLQAGLYFVKLYTGSGIINTKFVKE